MTSAKRCRMPSMILRAHEVGMIAGMRAALAEVLRRFDPAILQERTGTGGLLDSLMPAARRGKLWDLFEVPLPGALPRGERRFPVALRQGVHRGLTMNRSSRNAFAASGADAADRSMATGRRCAGIHRLASLSPMKSGSGPGSGRATRPRARGCVTGPPPARPRGQRAFSRSRGRIASVARTPCSMMYGILAASNRPMCSLNSGSPGSPRCKRARWCSA